MEYKFKYWDQHSDGRQVTSKEKHNKANQIATDLASQSKWLTHARSIKIDDLEKLGLKIVDYRKQKDLNDAITRYYMLLRVMFSQSPRYKIIETEKSEIYQSAPPESEMMSPPSNLKSSLMSIPESAIITPTCPKCSHEFKVQLMFKKEAKLDKDALPYPMDTDMLNCPNCDHMINMKYMRERIERQLDV